jgi:hypothetical protein
MWKQVSLLALLVALAACEGGSPNPVNGNPPTDDGGTDPEPEPLPDVIIPADIAENIESVQWDRGGPGDADDRLIVTGLALDDGQIGGVYTRAPAEDVAGYQAFYKQDDRLDRIYVAVSGEAADGSARAVAALDGGQLDTNFSGIFYERLTPLTRPDVANQNGLVSYAGTYAAVVDVADPEQNLAAPLRPGDPPAPPTQPRTLLGKIFMNVDFADNQVGGVIYDRQWSDGSPQGDEVKIILDPGALDENGNFGGDVRQELRPPAPTPENPFPTAEPPRGVGSYAGVLAGENASGMAGGLVADEHIRRVNAEGAFEDTPQSSERGVWVIPRCGESGAPDLCDGLGDIDGVIGE